MNRDNFPHFALATNMSARNHAPTTLILYDVRGQCDQSWLPSIWRIRLILNYKRIPYKTEWISFQDVENTLRELHVPPTSQRSDGRDVYTLPVLWDQGRRKFVSDTNRIAEYLEGISPARPVFPEGSKALQSLFVYFVQEVFSKPLLPIMVPLSHQQLPDPAQNYFRPGQPPANMLTGHQREQQWRAVQAQFDFLDGIISKNDNDGDGVVVMGRDLSYADFAVCAVLLWIKRMAGNDGWARVRTWNNGRWERLLDRCREFMDER
ncbi:hypothetical protein CPB83DRAFT_106535 [Crepidotus variabilis]|uniref:GST N-terminal domain-containing protein n=1 Tax=Crepidotus variabilis TaxID=179855 RepID=A0A9P6ELT9_9AGAR|nr:hypothetical protein CPB83DRAFT_106535 [Crepidotus variabilis]